MHAFARTWPPRRDRYQPPRFVSAAAAGHRLLGSQDVRRRVSDRGGRAEHSAGKPHTLLALAEAGHGVAIIPSILSTERYTLKIVRIAHRRKPLREGLVVQWDKRRPIPLYATRFCELLADFMREVLPITEPSARESATRRKQAEIRKRGRRTAGPI